MASDESSRREVETSSSPVSSTTNTSNTDSGNHVRVDGHTFWRARGTQRVIELNDSDRDRGRSGALPVDGLDARIAGSRRAGGEPLPRGLPLHGRRAGLDAAGRPGARRCARRRSRLPSRRRRSPRRRRFPARSAAAKPGPTARCATAPALSRSAWPASGSMSGGHIGWTEQTGKGLTAQQGDIRPPAERMEREPSPIRSR